jgi:sugar lactone lactonase YvrE
MARELDTLLTGGDFFEGPRWHDGHWYASDFYNHRVVRVSEDGEAEDLLTLDDQPSGLGWMPDGSMLVVLMRRQALLRRYPDGRTEEHADFSALVTGTANDMVVDADGRAYVGAFGFDLMAGEDPAETVLVRVDPDGTTAVAAEGMAFPNGTVITPDGGTLIVAETMGCRLTSFAVGADGSLGERSVFAQLAPAPTLGTFEETLGQVRAAPDGICLDADGHVWVADALGARCVRVAPGGDIVDEVHPPEGLGVFACMLGGSDGRTLLLCCAPDFFAEARAGAGEAVLVTATVDVPHAGLP